MRKHLIQAAALALLAAGCASPTLVKEPHWEKAQGPAAAEQAKIGKFKASMNRMMEVSQYLFETEGYLFTRRDDDTKTFTTDPFKLPGTDDPQSLQLVLTQEEGVVSAAWTHFQEIKYKNVDVCKDKPECQKALSDDWNWRLFKHLP